MQAVYSPPMQPKRRESSNQSAHYSTITSSEVSPPHRRAAPLIPLRLPTLRARLSVTSPQLPAPLATPDPVDLQSPEFIQIQVFQSSPQKNQVRMFRRNSLQTENRAITIQLTSPLLPASKCKLHKIAWLQSRRQMKARFTNRLISFVNSMNYYSNAPFGLGSSRRLLA